MAVSDLTAFFYLQVAEKDNVTHYIAKQKNIFFSYLRYSQCSKKKKKLLE